MKSRLASVRAAGGLDCVNRSVKLLEDEWQRNGDVQLRDFWVQARSHDSVGSDQALGLLAELVKADLRCRFENGQSPAVAEYLDQFPELQGETSRVVSLVYEEYCLNEERGTAPDVESFCDRYPDWKSSLVSQLQYHRNISRAAGKRASTPRFPEAGQVFDVFRLQSLLGSGGMSRVFLARDLSLGGKEVVLKVALDRGQEPKVQGPLDHPHIVPVNSVVYPAEGELCGLSMPYWPGLSLDKLLTFLEPARRPRKAVTIWQELQLGTRYSANLPVPGESSADSPAGALPSAPRGHGWDGFPFRGTYAQGVAWIVMIVARALHYAHGKKTFHRDVKPGNVLLTLQNGPQLLDFNLADSPHSAGHAHDAVHGGTLPYMAPEQIEAFINPDLWGRVGARADIYSLGLVLHELLTGQKPEVPDPAVPTARALRDVLDRRPFLDPSVRRFNPAIPHALEAIVAKCLNVSPDDRYADAQALEQDLDHFLKHEPLTHVTNPSRRERLGNWLTRQRRVLGAAACLLCACAAYPVIEAVKARPIHETKAFGSAARLLDTEKSATEAVARFKTLEATDPNSAVAKFYLGFALNASLKLDDKKQYDVDSCVRKALVIEAVQKSALKWARDHPKFASYLVEFAESRVSRADHLAEKYDNGPPIEDAERDSDVRTATYQLATDALLLAEKLDRGLLKTQFLLAKSEKYFGHFAEAYARISRVIGRFDPGSTNDRMFFSHEMRGWLACAWAEKDREGREVSSETRARLLKAGNDFHYCTQYLEKWSFGESQAQKKYYVMEHGLRTRITLAEVELDLAMPREAKKHLDECRDSAGRLAKFIESKKQLQVPSTEKLEARINDALLRLQRDHGTASRLSTNGPRADQP